MKKNLQIGFLMAVLSAGVAQAQQAEGPRIYREGGGWVEEISGSLAASRALKVKTDMGNVRVQGGAQAITFRFKMKINNGSEESARRRLASFRFSATRQGDTAVIIGDCRGDCPRNASTEFMVEVPSDTAQVMLQSGGGNLTVSGLNGEVAAGTGGGNLRLDTLGGPVSASSGGGNVDVGSVRSNLAVSTGGGNIHIGMAGGPLSVSTGGGEVVVETANSTVSVSTGGNDIHIGKVGGALNVNTGGGSIQIGDVGGAVIAETGGGDIRLSSARGQVRANTGGGNLQLWGVGGGIKTETGAGSITVEFVGGQPFTPSEVETGSGDIVVYIPSNLKVTVRAAVEFCNGGGITSDFSELRVHSEGGEYGHEVYADGSLNGGGPLLKIRAGNGSITIHRGKK